MSSLLDMMEGDDPSNVLESFDGDGLKSVGKIARRIREAEDEIKRAEEFLKEKKKDLLKMTDEDLPSVLQEMGVSSFTLDDGSKVEIKPLYAGHISANNKDAAFEWLRNNGHDDIIKNVVSCQFGRGEDNKAEEFYAIASAKGYVAQQKQDVHASTLKAWIRERVENGEEFPMEVFGAYISQRATIKGGK